MKKLAAEQEDLFHRWYLKEKAEHDRFEKYYLWLSVVASSEEDKEKPDWSRWSRASRRGAEMLNEAEKCNDRIKEMERYYVDGDHFIIAKLKLTPR